MIRISLLVFMAMCLVVTGDTTDKVNATALRSEVDPQLAGLIGLSALASLWLSRS